jgi:hypothetical protein
VHLYRDADEQDGEAGAGVMPQPPETPNGVVAPYGNDPALLTEDGLVRTA